MARKRTTKRKTAPPPPPPAPALVAIGQALRAARKAQGKTQGQIAHELGKTQPIISEYEGGKTLPDVRDIRDVARVYGVHPMMLLPETRAA